VAGVGNGLYSPPTRAALSHFTPVEHHRAVFSLRAVAANVGMALAPVAMFFLAGSHASWVFFMAGGLFILFSLVAWSILPELPQTQKESIRNSLQSILRDKRWVLFCLLSIGAWFLYGQIDSNIIVWANQRGGLAGMTGISMLFALLVAGLQLAVTQFNLTRKLANWQFVSLGTAMISVGLIVAGLLNSTVGVILTVLFFAIGATLLTPGTDLVTVEIANGRRENSYFATASLATAIGTSLSAPIGTLLILHSPTHVLPWVVMGTSGLAICWLTRIWVRKHNGAHMEIPSET
jgi:DHA1 family multidrug resistance protein-like MFS transporter